MDVLERLVALHEIRDMITRYALAFDDKDWDTFAELWADEAVFAANGIAFEGRAALLDFLTTCLPEDYDGKHMNSPSLIELGADGLTATARTDVVWISQDFENTIVGRYDDIFVKRDGSWLFARREETSVQYKPGSPPMSAAAMAVSSATMRH
jgi:uncharacterized protein (TIGR02246 family)